MAKKKVSSNEALCCGDMAYSPSMYVDFDKLGEIKGLSVGDKVRLVITGTVKSVEQRESYDDPKAVRGSLGIKDFEAEIIDDESNEFGALAEDD